MTPSSSPTSGLTRRQLLALSAAGIAGSLLVAQHPAAASAAARSVFAKPGSGAAAELAGFSTPEAATAPRFRWWWPNGEVELAEIAAEVKQAADNGFRGLEIANVHHSVDGALLDVENHGWGSPHWVAAVETALEAGEKHGVEIDMTLGPSWPAAIPGITPQDPSALVELAHGSVDLVAGQRFSGALPEPGVAPSAGVEGRTLVRVQAFRILSRPARNGIMLQHSSLVDLTDRVQGERLDWTAPAGAAGEEWTILAFWQRGTGQKPEAGPHTSPESYVVDHFSLSGADAIERYWESTTLTPRVRELLAKTGGTFFEDSLEVETHSTIWAREAATEFRTRIGYDLEPYLAGIVEVKEKYVYQFADVNAMRVRDDYNQVLSDLYSEYHLIPLRDWAHGFGLQYRVQAYGLEQDSLQQASIVDIPETESLGAKNLDDYRVLASGRDIGGRTILSCEAAAYLGKAYAVTWNEVLNTLGETFVGGVNQTVLHGFSYKIAPGAGWPGFAAFTPYGGGKSVGYSESWGPRMPVWNHLHSAADYLSRTQWVLRQGVPQYDIAFYRQKGWAQTGIGAPWATASGIPTGWTHGFLNEAGLFQERSELVDGVFAPEGGAYRAFVIDPDRFRGNEPTMSLRAAKRLRELAGAGFPIVFYGNWDKPESTGLRDAQTNAEVARIVAEIKALPTTRMAAGDADVPVALEALGVRPRVTYTTSHLKHMHRVDGDIDYYYLANVKHNFAKDKLVEIDQTVELMVTNPRHVPYLLDAWSGSVARLAAYEQNGDRATVRVRLVPGQSMVVAFGPEGWAGAPAPKTWIASTDVEGAEVGPKGELIVHSTKTGMVEVPLAGGRIRKVQIHELPKPVEIGRWDVVVSDWKPSGEGVETAKIEHRLSLDSLVPWSQIPEITDASGIGDYRAEFTLDHGWNPGKPGAMLSLGTVRDTFTVWINDQVVAERDFLDTKIDVSDYVQVGRNTIRVEVATPLNNRMRTVNPAVYGQMGKQEYGLMGPVTITPFGKGRVA
ncbi:glycosyl hydrolase [Microbacterium oryzae]|uniref:Alpha-L-rhamnosidase n=1 Tax=Microbacterium oryzae TaxID=743009 RepID=A0A6I6E5M8_9MICO|nr:glycosyl hydrolase [Microbacterium oryzae]QGU27730.1 alpha-L-rhamnosidase [Microbacterium oryzae]